jgi:type III pantothenate kinase
MSTTLCFDFGNTRKKVAVFNEAEIDKAVVLADDTTETIQSLIDTYQPRKSITILLLKNCWLPKQNFIN